MKNKPTTIDELIAIESAKYALSKGTVGDLKQAMYSLTQELRRRTEVEKPPDIHQDDCLTKAGIDNCTCATYHINETIKAQAKRWDDLNIKI